MAEVEEMSCKELVEVITDYLEGTMSERDRIRFDAHLEECPWCIEYLDQMRQIVRRALSPLTHHPDDDKDD